MSNLKPLVWSVNEIAATINITAESPLHNYTIYPDQYEGGYVIYYFKRMTSESGREYFNSSDEAKDWAESTHYPSKMKPYVKPMPTWINYKTEKPKEGDDVVITWLWMGDRHTIHLGNYSPRKIDYLDDAIEVYWSISPFVKQGE